MLDDRLAGPCTCDVGVAILFIQHANPTNPDCVRLEKSANLNHSQLKAILKQVPISLVCLETAPKENVNYCKVKCPDMVSPVCGTDNQTYKNKCTLFQQNCLKNQTVQISVATG